MTKAWCIWCEVGEMPKHGYYWICPECFEKIISVTANIKAVEEYLKGIRPKDHDSRRTVDEFLVDMADFNRRSRNTWKLIKSVTRGTPLEPLEEPPLSSRIVKEESS